MLSAAPQSLMVPKPDGVLQQDQALVGDGGGRMEGWRQGLPDIRHRCRGTGKVHPGVPLVRSTSLSTSQPISLGWEGSTHDQEEDV